MVGKAISAFSLFCVYSYFSPLINPGGLFADTASGMLVVYLNFFLISMSLPFNRMRLFVYSRFETRQYYYFWYLKKIFLLSFLFVTCLIVLYFLFLFFLQYFPEATIQNIINYYVLTIINLAFLNFIVMLIRMRWDTIISMIFCGLVVTFSYVMSLPQMFKFNVSFISIAYTNFNPYIENQRIMLCIAGYIFMIVVMSVLLINNKKSDIRI